MENSKDRGKKSNLMHINNTLYGKVTLKTITAIKIK